MKNEDGFFSLLWVNFCVGLKNFITFCKDVFRYWRNYRFMKCDIRLLASYVGSSPYRISKIYLQHQGFEEIYAYGETPLEVMENISRECGIGSKDVFFDLGCGRGRGCFWMREFIHCQVVGIDFIPDFIEVAKLVAQKCGIQQISFRWEDYIRSDLSEATVIYYYGICSSDEEVERLTEKFNKLRAGTKVITVSFNLNSEEFSLVKVFPVTFVWGKTDVYYQVKSGAL